MSDLMREEFEKEWGQTNEEQGLRFVAELNLYGCDLYLNSGMADRKSSAWFYFQKGWQVSREFLVIELPKPCAWDNDGGFDRESDPDSECSMALIPKIDVMQSIHAAGVKTK